MRTGVKESDTGLAPPGQWDLNHDKQVMQSEAPLQVTALADPMQVDFSNTNDTQVARCTKIINSGTEDAKYMINLKQVWASNGSCQHILAIDLTFVIGSDRQVRCCFG